MRHLRCPQRFLPGLEGGQLFPPGHDASRRAWSSFAAVPSAARWPCPPIPHRGQRQPPRRPLPPAIRRCPAAIWPRCPMWNSQPSVASTMSTAARTRGRSRPFAAPVKVDSGGAWRARPRPNPAGPERGYQGGPSPTARGPASASRSASPSTSSSTRSRGRHSRRAVRQGDAVEQHRPAERDDPDEAPGPPAPALPGPERHQMVRRSRNQTDPLPQSRWAR